METQAAGASSPILLSIHTQLVETFRAQETLGPSSWAPSGVRLPLPHPIRTSHSNLISFMATLSQQGRLDLREGIWNL
jgi:hypothetical protein